MIPVRQRIKHDPANGRWGDCHRACIASILELPYEDVPHFCDGDPTGEEFNRREREFLLQHGVVPIILGYLCDDLDAVLRCQAVCNPDNYYVLGGKSTTGTPHSVVCLNDEIVHNPNDAQIVGPLDDGLYLITFMGSTKSVHHARAERLDGEAQGRDADDPRQH